MKVCLSLRDVGSLLKKLKCKQHPCSYRLIIDISYRLAGDVVKILVGPLSTPFYVHKSLLCESSQYWDSELIAQGGEGPKDLTLSLPDNEPRVFAIYTHWLYFETLAVSSTGPIEEQNDLAMAYAFGDQISDHGFRNIIIDAIIEDIVLPVEGKRFYYPGNFMISHLYEHTEPEDSVRRLLVDIYAHMYRTRDFRASFEEGCLPMEFFHDLMAKLLTFQAVKWKPKNHVYHHIEATEAETGTDAT